MVLSSTDLGTYALPGRFCLFTVLPRKGWTSNWLNYGHEYLPRRPICDGEREERHVEIQLRVDSHQLMIA